MAHVLAHVNTAGPAAVSADGHTADGLSWTLVDDTDPVVIAQAAAGALDLHPGAVEAPDTDPAVAELIRSITEAPIVSDREAEVPAQSDSTEEVA